MMGTIRGLTFIFAAMLIIAACASTPSAPPTDQPTARNDVAPFQPGSSVEPVLIRGGGSPDGVFSLVFVADGNSYGGLDSAAEMAAFRGDVETIIANGFDRLSAMYRNRTAFHYYLLREPGRVTSAPCPSNLTFPDEAITRDALFADAFLILHKRVGLRDCYNGDRHASAGVAEGAGGSLVFEYGTAVHEVAHALFALPDEYSGSGGYWQTDPTGVLFTRRDACLSYVAAHFPVSNEARCTELFPASGGTMYRADGRIRDLMNPSGYTVVDQLGPADWRHFARIVGGRQTALTPPDVYAPETWGGP